MSNNPAASRPPHLAELDRGQPLSDLDAYSLILRIQQGEEPHPSWWLPLANWAEAKDERVREMEGLLKSADEHIEQMNERAA